jgi:hypothetical protein
VAAEAALVITDSLSGVEVKMVIGRGGALWDVSLGSRNT